MPYTAHAAYDKENDFMPLSSIRLSPAGVKEWICDTYVGEAAQKNMEVVRISIRRLED